MSNKFKILATNTIGIKIPANRKYVSNSYLGQVLIKRFMNSMMQLVSHVNPKEVLDVGCGEGLVLRQLELLKEVDLFVGIDNALEKLVVSQVITSNVYYIAGDAYMIPVSKRAFDLVICNEVLEHLLDPSKVLENIIATTRNYCILSVPNEPWWRLANMSRGKYLKNYGNTPGHVNHWSVRTFADFVGKYMDIEVILKPLPWTIILGKAKLGQR